MTTQEQRARIVRRYRIKQAVERLQKRMVITADGCHVAPHGNTVRVYLELSVPLEKKTTRKGIEAHKLIWEHHYGPPPEGFKLHHDCFHHPCFNVEHLSLRTWSDHQTIHRQKERGGR
jgi:HNH endonuclease